MGLGGAAFSIDISPDEKYVLAGDWNGFAESVDLTTEEEVRRFYGSQQVGVWNAVFSPDGLTIFSSTLEPQGDVIQWRIADWPLDELHAWINENRYVRELKCDERAQYHVEPLCK